MNNSEVLTILLLISVAMYTYARIRSHVVLDGNDDEEKLEKLVSGSNPQG